MESYTSFAQVYDTFMDQTPYEQWADQMQAMIEKYGLSRPVKEAVGEGPDLVVDLGCGTGRLTELLAARGYSMLGVDLSVDMLGIAQNRKLEAGSDSFYVCQDMRDLQFPGTVGTFVSAGDSVNYLVENEGLLACFRGVAQALEKKGVFIFDFKTLHLYRDVIGERTIAEDREDCAFIWDNFFDEETRINEYDLTLFIQCSEEDPDQFRRFEEVHYQRGYTLEEVQALAAEAGLSWVTGMDGDDFGPIREDSERILAVVRKD